MSHRQTTNVPMFTVFSLLSNVGRYQCQRRQRPSTCEVVCTVTIYALEPEVRVDDRIALETCLVWVAESLLFDHACSAFIVPVEISSEGERAADWETSSNRARLILAWVAQPAHRRREIEWSPMRATYRTESLPLRLGASSLVGLVLDHLHQMQQRPLKQPTQHSHIYEGDICVTNGFRCKPAPARFVNNAFPVGLNNQAPKRFA